MNEIEYTWSTDLLYEEYRFFPCIKFSNSCGKFMSQIIDFYTENCQNPYVNDEFLFKSSM